MSHVTVVVAGIFAAISLSQLGCNNKTIDSQSTTTSSTTNADTPPTDVTGNYRITSAHNPNGSGAYTGDVAIDKRHEVLRVHWSLGSAQTFHGVAIQTGNVVGVGWGKGKSYGAVIYTVNGGSLKGAWAAHDSDKIGVENLSGPPGLNGDYAIVQASVPGSSATYSGNVHITPTGNTYAVTWKLTSGESYGGVGIKEGDKLIVGWASPGSEAGVVDYKVNGSDLAGTWATPGGTQLGVENLSRK